MKMVEFLKLYSKETNFRKKQDPSYSMEFHEEMFSI